MILRQYRLAASLSQEALGERAQLSPNTIAALERGRRTTPRPATVVLLAKALHLQPAQRSALIAAANDARMERFGNSDDYPASVMPPTDSASAPLSFSRFVGREVELARLKTQLAAAASGQGGIAILAGEPGIGKTRLVEQFAVDAQDSAAFVVWGHCYEGASAPPYGPWAEAIGALAVSLDTHRLRRALGSVGPALAQLTGELQASLPNVQQPAPLTPPDERLRLYDAVTRFVRAAAEDQPLVLVLDDLHWVDHDSLGLLRYLARFVGSMHLLLVGTYRDVQIDRGHPLSDALTILRREARCEHISLRGLSYPEVVDYLCQVADDELPTTLLEHLYAETAGSPLYVRELFRHLIDEGRLTRGMEGWRIELGGAELGVPEGIRHVLRERLSRLSNHANMVLRHAAAFNSGFEFRVLRAVVDLSEDALLDCIDEALAAGLIRATGTMETYEFTHAVVRHALDDELSVSRKARLHRRIAEGLEHIDDGPSTRYSAEIAAQYLASASLPGAERGIPHALVAAQIARAGYAHEQATKLLRLARDLARDASPQVRADVLRRLALAEAEAVNLDDAPRTVTEALEALVQAGVEQSSAVDFLTAAARLLKEAGAHHTSWEPLVDRGFRLIGGRRDLAWARLALLQDHFEVISTGLVSAARWHGHDPMAISIARDRGDEDDYAHSLDPLEWRSRDDTNAVLVLARTWQRPTAVMHALNVCARDLLYRHAEFREGADRYRELLAAGARYGSIPTQAEALAQMSACLRAVGELPAAAEMLGRAHEMVGRLGSVHRLHFVVDTGMASGLAYLVGGDWPALATRATQFMSGPNAARSPLGLTAAAYAAFAHARAGNRTQAQRILEALVELLQRMEPTMYIQNLVRDIVAAAAWELSAKHLADRVRRLALDLIAAEVGASAFGSPELSVARMAALNGDNADASRYFNIARKVLESGGQRPLRAIVDYDEALALLRSGSGEIARPSVLLDAALDEFRALGMEEWAQRTVALEQGALTREHGLQS